MESEKTRNHLLLAFGVTVCLTAAALMAFGEALLGESQTGIATVVLIIGIGFTAWSTKTVPKQQNIQSRVP